MTSSVRLEAATAEDTRAVAATVAGALRPGDVVALTGELGAGKTCFVQGAAAALGVRERVTSPSFLLRKEYTGAVRVLHLDVYRLDSLAEVADLGYDDALGESYVTFIEWGDAMRPLLPGEHLEVELVVADPARAPVNGDEPRRIVVRAHGEGWLRRLPPLAVALGAWISAPAGDEER